jgi:hypothetical protein
MATGKARHLSGEKYLLAGVFTNVRGHLRIEQSHNGINWHVIDEAAVPENRPIRLVSEAICEYARAVYENGNQRQNSFQLFTCVKGDR